MVRVLFCVASPDLKSDFLQQPVEVLYTGTLLQEEGHEVTILDLRVQDTMPEKMFDAKPDLIFLLTQTYDLSQCYSLTLHGAREAVAALRASSPNIPIVTVGMHGSIEPEATARDLGTDLILPGELEAAVPWFISAYEQDPSMIKQPLPLEKVPRQIDPTRLPVPNYDLINPEWYYGEVVDPLSKTLRFDKTGLIFANRGCPYACAYCFVWFGKKLRYRPVSLVVEELARQVAHGVRHFFFLDYTFTMDKNWVRQLCMDVKAAGLDISWVCQTRCERVDPDILALMRSAGCTGVFYGVETPWIAQTNMAKPLSLSVIDEAIRATNAAGISYFLFMMLGLEGKDPVVARQLVEWLTHIPATFEVGPLLPRPHTTLWQRHSVNAAESWEDVAGASQSIAQQHYWCAELDELQASLQRLPNYILNASATLAGPSRVGQQVSACG